MTGEAHWLRHWLRLASASASLTGFDTAIKGQVPLPLHKKLIQLRKR